MSSMVVLHSTRSGQRYRLEREFHIGSFLMHEAYDTNEQPRWVKQVPAESEVAIAWLRYEAIMLSKLKHQTLVKLLDRGRSRSCFFLVLEPAAGRPLLETIATGPAPLAVVTAVARQLVQLLGYFHSCQIVCRELPISAFYLNDTQQLTCVDLSAAWDELSPVRSDALLNPLYLSPEEAGGGQAERRSDIYAVGVLLFELLVGRPPFQSTQRGDLALHHLLTSPPDVQTFRAEVPPALAEIVRTCLAKRPSQRFPSAEALAEALGSIHYQLNGKHQHQLHGLVR